MSRSGSQGEERANKDVKMFMACQGLLLSPASQVCKQTGILPEKKTNKKIAKNNVEAGFSDAFHAFPVM